MAMHRGHGAAAGAGGLSGGIPGRAVHRRTGGGGCRYGVSAELLAPLLPGKTAVENPGYQRAKQVLENNGVACCCLPVDADGLSVEALSGSGAAVCYVTPSHQFPTA